jgi:choline dehydrogenase-like flavoprotein
MIGDFSTLSASPPDLDVAVVGAGPAGLAAALRLAGKGLRVGIFEAGGPKADIAAQEEAFAAAAVAPERHPPLHLYRRRQLGGSSAIWGGRCIPFDSSDYDPLPLGDGAEWPIGQADVAPYIDQALSWLGAGLPQFTAEEALPGEPAPLIGGAPDARLSMDRLERFSQPMDVWRAYGETLRSSLNIFVFGGCPCVEVLASGETPVATGLVIAGPGGERLTVKPRVIVLAAGGLETPRLLLASRSGRPAGLGNGTDLVGRFYMTHLVVDCGLLTVVGPAELDYSISTDGVYVRRLLQLTDQARRERKLMNLIARPTIPDMADPAHRSAILSAGFIGKRFILAEYRRRLVSSHGRTALAPHIANIARGVPDLIGFGIDWSRRRTFAKRKLPSLFIKTQTRFPMELVCEQAPYRESRVRLGGGLDRIGLPRLNLQWKTGQAEVDTVQTTLDIFREALGQSGAASLSLTPDQANDPLAQSAPQGGHHIGTTRMAASATGGVVDGWGAMFEAGNVFIVGSAVFPRSGAANPTLTLVALAMRTADRIIGELGS